ncbi:mobile mystery protein B [Taishania pollutisoli]|uniref:mobile mystery protein B n=1 Tax=Taishania pollutisoli TaxID=2766479 RepID=UPI001F417588|nr:mobile mystery protein B [Taishania pollutisoli]
MYGEIWKWAGTFRKSEKNIGVKSYLVATDLKYLLDDARFWVEHETYSPDELSIRFKHRLVAIHCFPNGNGRHSRLMADIISEKIFGNTFFSWEPDVIYPRRIPSGTGISSHSKTADKGDYYPLMKFA